MAPLTQLKNIYIIERGVRNSFAGRTDCKCSRLRSWLLAVIIWSCIMGQAGYMNTTICYSFTFELFQLFRATLSRPHSHKPENTARSWPKDFIFECDNSCGHFPEAIQIQTQTHWRFIWQTADWRAGTRSILNSKFFASPKVVCWFSALAYSLFLFMAVCGILFVFDLLSVNTLAPVRVCLTGVFVFSWLVHILIKKY